MERQKDRHAARRRATAKPLDGRDKSDEPQHGRKRPESRIVRAHYVEKLIMSERQCHGMSLESVLPHRVLRRFRSRRSLPGELPRLRTPNFAGDLLCPRINIRPLAIVARVPTEGSEEQPPPGGPVIKISLIHISEPTRLLSIS